MYYLVAVFVVVVVLLKRIGDKLGIIFSSLACFFVEWCSPLKVAGATFVSGSNKTGGI